MESVPVEEQQGEDVASPGDVERVLVDRVAGKMKRDWSEGGWTELQRVRGMELYRLLMRNGAFGFALGSLGPVLTTQELLPFVRVTDELFGERLKELAMTLEIENAYGYSYSPPEDETVQGRLDVALREVSEWRLLNAFQVEQIGRYTQRVEELAAERDALQRIVDGRAAIAEAEPAFDAVENTLERRG